MKDFKLYLIAASLLLLVYVVIQYNKPKALSWSPTLYYGDKIPFGTYVLYDRLNDMFPGAAITNTNKSIYAEFDEQLKPGNYIIIARRIVVTKEDFGRLIKYISAGNTVFMSTFNWSGKLSEELKIETGVEGTDERKLINFTNPSLRQLKDYSFSNDISSQYFSQFDTTRATVISRNTAGDANYISYKFGKGTLLLCANPELFTNFSLLTPQGADYAQRALSYLPAKQNIYWDEYQNHDIITDGSPVRVFLNNPSLQWAYYLSLLLLFIYILFEMKRRQRVIPVVEPLKNSTVDFINVVGRVYYEKRDNADIAYKKVLYLLNHLREKYQLKTNKLDNEFIEALVNKTGVAPSLASELVNYISYLDQQTKVNDHELIVLNQLIEKFYSQS